MRYSVHPSRAFRNRIAKSIGVLVAAALIATLGLPSAAQAQNITDVTYADGPGFTVMWEDDRGRVDMRPITGWTVTFTEPDKTMVSVRSIGANITPVVHNENDIGTWWIEVGACFDPLVGDDSDTCPEGELESGDSVGYTHGAPDEPKNFAVSLVPDGVALTWDEIKSDYDYGIKGYQYSTDDFETEKSASGGAKVVKVKPGDYTFMLRAVGRSDNDTSTTGDIPGVAASEMVTVPMPTPTLPEIAAFFLAMLLLGSGAYLLRRRQSGGLTPA